ncbi:cholesterol 7-desaturase-like [Eurytemora carolleeae]|uniref:cholesterol 7-desaturase-like n=1 Tax=Eurytemora carolleeae TaxID=1294199 RepID=UPI000C76AFEC|nr:cholesterol 7-desaturase-like [Eurytemora carolleeae]|eukprot:XP_023325306.1 cholesterol 7-desaturase-like [Eurytemora affinis]
MFLDTCCTLEIVVQGVGCIALVFSLILLFYVFCLPMNRIRQVEEVGFTHLKHGQFFKKNIKIARKLRKTGSSSKIFPNGWYVVLGKPKYL